MNKKYARELAETITNAEIADMFDNAKKSITDWEQTAIVNKGITKGTVWNILTRGFNRVGDNHVLVKTNIVREFGDYLPEHLKQKPKQKVAGIKPVHQEPVF